MSLTMAWKSPPRAPHSFSAVSMLRPGARRQGAQGARGAVQGRGRTAAGAAPGPRRGSRLRAARSAAGRAALRGCGPWAGGAGHGSVGMGARRGQFAAQPRRGHWIGGGGNPSRRSSGVTWARRREGRGEGAREGAVGKAGRARTHSRPETRALKSELRRCQTGRARGAGGSGRHHGSGRRRGGARSAPPPHPHFPAGAASGLHLQGLGLDKDETCRGCGP